MAKSDFTFWDAGGRPVTTLDYIPDFSNWDGLRPIVELYLAAITVSLDPASMPWTGQTLQVNAKTQIPTDPASTPWTGQSLAFYATIYLTLDPCDEMWTPRPLVVNAKTQIACDPADESWTGRTLEVVSGLRLDVLSMPWTGQALNVPDPVALDPASMPWTGQAFTFSADLVTLDPASMPWTGQSLAIGALILPVTWTVTGRAPVRLSVTWMVAASSGVPTAKILPVMWRVNRPPPVLPVTWLVVSTGLRDAHVTDTHRPLALVTLE